MSFIAHRRYQNFDDLQNNQNAQIPLKKMEIGT